MCGIAGHLSPRTDEPPDVDAVAKMSAALAHRGPDDHGGVRKGPIVLAHRRLAIVDLSASARQPFASEDGRVLAVVNGEFYEHAGLRGELEQRGHRFRSRTDSEVVVHLYEEAGTDCLQRLVGMFALAIWDDATGELVLARDRFGKKPLYWSHDARGFWFASELDAVRRALPLGEADVDLRALDLYLALGYIPAPSTAFRGVEKLPAGHLLRVRPGGAPRIERYYRLPFAHGTTSAIGGEQEQFPSLDAASSKGRVARLRTSLESAVRARLGADVALGAFLSGGVDSSAIVALMARVSGAAPHAFTVVFDGDDAPELPYARAVAAHVGARHDVLTVRADPERALPLVARIYGEPFADPSAIPTYYLSQAARAHVTVALSGDGGDEIFGGYRRYLYAQIARSLASLPKRARAGAKTIGRWLPGEALSVARRVASLLDAGEAERYFELVGVADAERRFALYSPDAWPSVAPDPAAALFSQRLRESDAEDPLGRLQDLDVQTYLADCILPKVDIASMAHGLEVRAPLLDHRLAQRVVTLAPRFKLRRGRGKWLLRRAVEDLLPRSIVWRRKRGFDPPMDRWLRGPLAPLLADALSSLGGRPMFRRTAIESLAARWCAGHESSHFVYALVVLELWLRGLR